MKPEYNKTNDLVLHVVVATGSRPRAVELVRRMEKSNHFRQAEIVAENVTANVGDQSAGPGNIQFDIAAVYLPSAPDTDAVPGADEDRERSGGQQRKTISASTLPTSIGARAGSANQEAQVQNQTRPAREREH
jgi:hypothetical protein